jgi:AraC-like DNA-binding protein
MPRIIRQALGERIRQNAELQSFLARFREATGVPAEFVCAYGHGECATLCANSPLCQRLMRDPAGRQVCHRFRQRLLEAAHTAPATLACESGVVESAVPMRVAGETVGYLVTGGFLPAPADRQQLNRARHLLRRAGVNLDDGELLDLSGRTPVVPSARHEALVHLLGLAAEHLTAKVTERLTAVEARMPALVDRACRIVHAEFAQRIAVPAVARRLGVSEGHLSRTFHRATGLRLVEYVARFRAERARVLLAEGDQPVTDVAFACGFQSLSQFNRVFLAQFGLRPSKVRPAAAGS